MEGMGTDKIYIYMCNMLQYAKWQFGLESDTLSVGERPRGGVGDENRDGKKKQVWLLPDEPKNIDVHPLLWMVWTMVSTDFSPAALANV